MIRSSPSRQALFLFLALDYDDGPETRHLPADPCPMNDLNHVGHVLVRFAYLLIHRASLRGPHRYPLVSHLPNDAAPLASRFARWRLIFFQPYVRSIRRSRAWPSVPASTKE